jgi:hypothetical protein
MPEAQSYFFARKAKAADPQFFHGDRKKLREFFAQVAIKFATNPELFPNEESKVGYATSYLRGHAFSLYASMMPDGVMPFSTFSDLRQFLESAFGDPDARTTAEHELRRLRQGDRPCTHYFADFTRIMATLQFDEASKIYEFRNGLRDEVRDLLIGRDIPSDYNAFVRLCISLDSAWLARQQEKKLRQPQGPKVNQQLPRSKDSSSHQTHQSSPLSQSTTQPPASSSSTVGYSPMDLDSIQIQNGHLTQAEKNRRRQEGLCLYCGQPGHFANGCPTKNKPKSHRQPLQIQSAALTIDEPANTSVLYSLSPSGNDQARA